MARRRYYVNKKRRKIEDSALLMLRRTRERIDPDLIDTAREAIAGAIESDRRKHSKANDMVFLDRRNVIDVVARYLEMNPDNKAVTAALQSFIKGH